jgi:plastocyanin
MHLAALHLAPVLAAEKSKVPFYIAGGALVVWALLLSVGIGFRRADFPGSLQMQRAIMAGTAVLVAIAAATAVITSGTPEKATAAGKSPSEAASEGATGATSATTASAPTTTPSTPAAPPAAARKQGGKAAKPKVAKPKAAGATKPAPAGSAVTDLRLAADPSGQLAYDTKELKAKAGTVTITFANPSPLEHNVTIAAGGSTLGATPTFAGGKRSLTLTLKPGRYTFFCSVPGHRQAGMEGTLTVS